MKIGVYQNTNEEYHGGEGVSVSDLKLMREKTPLHLWDKKFNPDSPARKQTLAMMIGTAIHCAVLEPDEFPYRYSVMPEGLTRASKIGKEYFAEVTEAGLQPITPDQYAMITKMADAVRRQPWMRKVMRLGGVTENSIYWQCRRTGVLCRMRPDLMIEPCSAVPYGLIVDVKSAVDANEERFAWSSLDLMYHMQGDWYRTGFQQTFGTKKPPLFVLMVVEKESPWAVAPYTLTEAQLMLGKALNTRLLDQYAECLATDTWPGYHAEPKPMELPPRGLKELQDILQQTNP